MRAAVPRLTAQYFAIKDQTSGPDIYLCERCLPCLIDYEPARGIQEAPFASGGTKEDGGRRDVPRKWVVRWMPAHLLLHPHLPSQSQPHTGKPSPPSPSDKCVPLTHNIFFPSVPSSAALLSAPLARDHCDCAFPADAIGPYAASMPVRVPPSAGKDKDKDRTLRFLHLLPPAHPSHLPSCTLHPIVYSSYVVRYACPVKPAASTSRLVNTPKSTPSPLIPTWCSGVEKDCQRKSAMDPDPRERERKKT